MISIITAIHNGLAMNRLFLESLRKYSSLPFELIIVDNNSADGSREFFKSAGAKVIENKENYAYAYCQNQGIRIASHHWLAFLNNDVIVAPGWDKRLTDIATSNALDVITPCGIERAESPTATRKLRRRWKAVKNITRALAGTHRFSLQLMMKLMYGDWEKFSAEREAAFGNQVVEGFVGNTVLMTRTAVEKAGLWDERIQAADFDLYIRCKQRWQKHGDLKPPHIAMGVFNHHYIRLTVGSKPKPFADRNRLISLEEKYGKAALDRWLKDNVST